MNAFRTPSASSAVHPEPGFQAILRLVADHYGIPHGQLRSAEGERAEGARATFIWLCDYLKTRGTLASATFIGMPYARATEALTLVDVQRAADPAVQAELEELALSLQVEAAAYDRLQLHRTTDATPVEIARRALASLRSTGMVGTEEMQMLASAYIARVLADGEDEELRVQLHAARADVEQLRTALSAANRQIGQMSTATHPLERLLRDWTERAIALERASGPAERSARQHFEKASIALQGAAETHFNIKRKFK